MLCDQSDVGATHLTLNWILDLLIWRHRRVTVMIAFWGTASYTVGQRLRRSNKPMRSSNPEYHRYQSLCTLTWHFALFHSTWTFFVRLQNLWTHVAYPCRIRPAFVSWNYPSLLRRTLNHHGKQISNHQESSPLQYIHPVAMRTCCLIASIPVPSRMVGSGTYAQKYTPDS